jgi:hypothetical protein
MIFQLIKTSAGPHLLSAPGQGIGFQPIAFNTLPIRPSNPFSSVEGKLKHTFFNVSRKMKLWY